MPGLYGQCRSGITTFPIQTMGEMLCHSQTQVPESEFEDGQIVAGRVPVNGRYARCEVGEVDGVYAWVDGEILNARELGLDETEKNDQANLMAGLFSRGETSHIKDLNGFFSAVVYDSNRKKIHLISDRFGLRHLFDYY